MILYYFLRWMVIVVVGLLIYGQTFRYGFVFDDYIFIVTNPFIKNFSNFKLMWHSFPLTRSLGMFTFSLNYHFSQLNPWSYHVFNFIVHLICVGLVWALAGLLFKITKTTQGTLTKELPFIIALLFLVHPCQTQAVTYVAQRFESMATMFYLATIYFYLSARISTTAARRIIMSGLAGLAIALGILTKEVFITVPVMVLACEWILFPAKGKKKFNMLLIGGAVLLLLVFTRLVHSGMDVFLHTLPSESHDGDVLTPAGYFLTQMRVFLTFLRLLVLPIHQNVDYDYPMSTGWLHPPLTLVGLGVIIGFIILIIKLRRPIPLIAFGLAWILITFSINLAPRSNVIFEHKLYLISFGFFLAFVTALFRWVPDRGTVLKIIACILVVLVVTAFERNKVWANELALWGDGIKRSPHKARVNANLGRIYGSLGQYDQSIEYLTRAIAISPDNITYENRGVIYSLQGRMAQALEDLNTSISMDPDYFVTYVKRAWVYDEQHKYKAAMDDLGRAIQLDAYFPDSYIERGMIWVQIGHNEKALEDFQEALRIDPFNAQAAQYRDYCLSKINQK